MKRRVLVAMSGGVDSSVAAALLVDAGYEVIGATLKLWSEGDGFSESGCCTATDAADARRVASQLGIDYYVFDFVESFKEAVVDPFIDSYAKGMTPNPCVECNRSIKFSVLLDRALHLGCDLLATGHHARIRHCSDRLEGIASERHHKLLRGKDLKKDQSYVLYMLDQPTLERLILPIGELTKSEVRAIAASKRLRTASKPESQDVCFAGTEGVDSFLARHGRGQRRVRLVDGEGNVLGVAERNSLTVGQRRGLGLASGSRMYIREIRPESGAAELAPREDLYRKSILTTDFNWISGCPQESGIKAEVQVRYNSPPTPARLFPLEGGIVDIEFEAPVWAPAPGQIAVAYDGDEVLGGGVISRRVSATI
jgi:tRNA-specific 2-thiouridylase